jgi:hypothetical protein
MKTLFLIQIGRQLLAIDKECVVGVGVRDDDKVKPVEENGKTYLPLPHGNRAIICDLPTLMNGRESLPISKRGHYLIVAHDENLMALTMSGKGRIVMADVAAALPLPPAFIGKSRNLIPGALINCSDLILLLDLHSLHEAIGEAVPALQVH